MSTLIVVAHPDDEALGAGAMAADLAARGESVRTCILSGDVGARAHRPALDRLRANMLSAHRVLGLPDPIVGDFPNIEFNTVPHLALVQFIEAAMVETGATALFTHPPRDLNNDHLHVSLACQAAARLFQRRASVAPLQRLAFVETLSSTDWAFPDGSGGFQPNAFFEITEEALEKKIAALEAYEGVMRPSPHPRRAEVIRALASYRGGQAGVHYAEAYQVVFERLH